MHKFLAALDEAAHERDDVVELGGALRLVLLEPRQPAAAEARATRRRLTLHPCAAEDVDRWRSEGCKRVRRSRAARCVRTMRLAATPSSTWLAACGRSHNRPLSGLSCSSSYVLFLFVCVMVTGFSKLRLNAFSPVLKLFVHVRA